jgi:hypothetical protein
VGSGYQTDPTGTPLIYSGTAGVVGNGSELGNPDAPQGTQAGYLQGTGSSISYSSPFPAGTYTLSFAAAQSTLNTASESIQVVVDGSVVDTFTPGAGGYAAYSTVSFYLTAAAHTIAFVGLDADGQDIAFIDQVAINLLVE